MKKFIYAATAAVAAMAMAPQAQAVDIITDDINMAAGLDTFGGLVGPGVFTLTFNFTLGTAGLLDATIISNFNGLEFTSVTLGGFSLLEGLTAPYNTASLAPTFFAAGMYDLEVTGVAAERGLFTGTLTLAPAVPEPATWAMMVAGIAAVGTALRRRSTVARVSFS